MNRADFQNLAGVRLTEAQALLASGGFSGAYYLCGYAVECALKACIARRTQQYDFPPRPEVVRDVYTHDLLRLVRSAGLHDDLSNMLATDPVFNRYWTAVRSWSEQSRYETYTQVQANNLIDAVSDPVHGVLVWLQRYW